jgi:hypothetical protein
VSGEPVAMRYCHCESCRHWSAGPVNAFSLWQPTAVHPPLKLTDVFAAMLPGLKFKPAVHVNYQEAVLRIKDGLPKMKDFPKDMGGSGATLAE